MIDYDGRKFRKAGGDAEAIAVYRQEGDVVWAEFAGGDVRRGSIAGTQRENGALDLGYTIVLATGEVICGRTVNTPEVAEDGRLRLREAWERYGPHAATGVSYLDEVS
ncbi:hypothetical protein BS329_08520 [Amycolatopsis coloradensis]|uniref:Uncharacterized protein n=1 Tax=Amycolatopsis coloradensis TaxID=76021 RepID=A0A1R0KYY0_9PSEU|nr:hypothetical protein [Amycolatopsis coloradensis]OLZ54556.1 hypothetical protein BS329_08520 [Amycolatopsis coloradensis]